MPEEKLLILNQGILLKWCEICLQSDCFNPVSNYCFRCNPIDINIKKTINNKPIANKSHKTLTSIELQNPSSQKNSNLITTIKEIREEISGSKDLQNCPILKSRDNLIARLLKTEPPVLSNEPEGCLIRYQLNTPKNTSILMIPNSLAPIPMVLFFSTFFCFIAFGLLKFPISLLEFIVVVALLSTIWLCASRIQKKIIITPNNLLIESEYRFKTRILEEVPLDQILSIEVIEKHSLENKDTGTVLHSASLFCIKTDKTFFRIDYYMNVEDCKWLANTLNHCIYKQAKDSALSKEKLFDWE